MSGEKWRVTRSRDQWTGVYGMWTAASGWRFINIDGSTYIKCDISQFATWREAFDYADGEART